MNSESFLVCNISIPLWCLLQLRKACCSEHKAIPQRDIGRHAVMSFRQRRQARPWDPPSIGRQKLLGKITSSIHGLSASSRASQSFQVISQLVNRLFAIYCARSFVAVFRGARHWSLSCPKPLESNSYLTSSTQTSIL
jgi:hypothetical protein